MTYKLAFCALLALIAGYWGIATLGATGSFSDAFNAVAVAILAAWLGWMIRDCDEA